MRSKAGTWERLLCPLLACLGGLTFVPIARPQDADDQKAVRQDIATLKKDVKAIGDKQQQIIDQLNELKRLLQANSGVAPLFKPPATMGVQGEPFQGNSTARIAVIEYGDFECPACGAFSRETYPQIVANYIKNEKVKYFYRDLTMTIHPHAIPAARAAHCAGEQGKFWEMHDSLFANQAALAEKDVADRARGLGLDVAALMRCLSSDRYLDAIRKSSAEAQAMGINATPTFLLGVISPSGDVVKIEKTIVGAYPYATFKVFLDNLLASETGARFDQALPKEDPRFVSCPRVAGHLSSCSH